MALIDDVKLAMYEDDFVNGLLIAVSAGSPETRAQVATNQAQGAINDNPTETSVDALKDYAAKQLAGNFVTISVV